MAQEIALHHLRLCRLDRIEAALLAGQPLPAGSSFKTANSVLAEFDRTSKQRGRFTKRLQRAEDRSGSLELYRKLSTDEENVGTSSFDRC
ncbi:MAG: hypothetical protein ABI586_05105 [Candidatus Nanopelagicales bacterium]